MPPAYIVPVTTPGPGVTVPGPAMVLAGVGRNPVSSVPGLTPALPVRMLAPVLVTVDAPRTAKPCAEPSDVWADAAETLRTIAASMTIAESRVARRSDT